ncbi:Na/Ca antiporter [Legionella quinlivanii]|uniref:Na/Ca antiporter n=1 Tax=Legionella quinlivanii TaxID=45073 RepID=A0A0W0XZ40_9GAMM|nr:calcium/sodium antiporter [Legionella quinlivanii]KTD49980.1 Na/Ca antiporter [Legionella quinlivanii]MCW8450575.1 calcium/sodium antiporter [Legionella quinlivanii]SEF95771.1 cation:H+ antiporter [Legionella quinlivanii DSM 21216]STY11244.1 Ca2 /Na antiporter [Legionella quinlivanii]
MYHFFLLLISFIALLWSANHLVVGASGIAHYYKLSPLWIGFSLVALGTSAPEIVIAVSASLDGYTDLAVGNAVGSNIANIGLVLGLIALLRPLNAQTSFLKREFPLLFIVMLFAYSLMLDGYLGILDSCLALIVCLIFTAYLIISARESSHQRHLTDEFWRAKLRQQSLKHHVAMLIVGLIILPFSADLLITNCAQFARDMGMSELLVGLSIVAIGSSLPELATSIVAASKGADDIAIGNILGSNLFNLLAVMIFPGIIHPSAISHAIIWRDMPVMLLTTLLLFWFNMRHKKKITRWHGGLLILIYCSYILSLVIAATR